MSRGGSPGCAANLAVDQVLHDNAVALGVAVARVDTAGAASFNGTFPPCACAAADASCLVLWRRGEQIWLDAILSMNSTVLSKDDKSEC